MRLPHWAIVALSFASAALAWLVTSSQSGSLVLPAALLGVLPVIQGVIGILSSSASPATNLAAARKAAPSLFKVGAACLALCFVLGGAVACQACTNTQATQVATVAVDTAVCVLNHETDPPATIVAECGAADVQQVLQILDAHVAAEARERAADGGSP